MVHLIPVHFCSSCDVFNICASCFEAMGIALKLRNTHLSVGLLCIRWFHLPELLMCESYDKADSVDCAEETSFVHPGLS